MKQYKSNEDLRSILGMSGDLSVSTDIFLSYLPSFNLAGIQLRSSNHVLEWVESTASKVIVESFAISIGLERDNEKLGPVLKYLLVADNEIANFTHISTFVHSSSPQIDYAKSVYLASNNKY